jgi:hypothetical protein
LLGAGFLTLLRGRTSSFKICGGSFSSSSYLSGNVFFSSSSLSLLDELEVFSETSFIFKEVFPSV